MLKALLCLTIIGLLAALSACGGVSAENAAPEVVFAAVAPAESSLSEPVVRVPDPQRAAAAIYQALGNTAADRLCGDLLDEVFGLAPDMVIDAVSYRSNIADGLCDIVIALPMPGKADEVREALNQYLNSRAASFRNFDIRDSYAIATNAVVFEQAGYVVMLMTPDNEIAREILDQYLPG